MGMSTPAPSAPSSPWFSPPFLLTAVLVLVGLGTTWGVFTAQLAALERAQVEDRAQIKACTQAVAALEVRAATFESAQVSTRLLIDTQMDAVRRELERLAKALERLADEPLARARR
jgi:hypothetical protein